MPNLPEECRRITADYLVSSDSVYEWVCEKYEHIEKEDRDPRNIHYIYVSDMYELFKSGSYYENMTKAEKRLMNMKNFDDKIQNNIYLKELYMLSRGYINGFRVTKPCIMHFREPVTEKAGAEDTL